MAGKHGKNPNSLKNLKRWPKGYCPAIASKAGFGQENSGAQCGHIRRDGTQCKKVAITGKKKCATHGGGYRNPIAEQKRKERNQIIVEARNQLEALKPLDPELTRSPIWLALSGPRLFQSMPARVNLVLGWNAAQQGHSKPWRDAVIQAQAIASQEAERDAAIKRDKANAN